MKKISAKKKCVVSISSTLDTKKKTNDFDARRKQRKKNFKTEKQILSIAQKVPKTFFGKINHPKIYSRKKILHSEKYFASLLVTKKNFVKLPTVQNTMPQKYSWSSAHPVSLPNSSFVDRKSLSRFPFDVIA